MREILFKAKRITTGEWVEGFFVNAIEEYGNGERTAEIIKMNAERICSGEYSYLETYVVDINTLCQYTGLTDKNGNKIWENDVVECKNDKSHFQSQIEWDKSYCGFILQDSETSAVGLDAITKGGIYKDVQVIGNIFDNPELLGV